MKGNDTTRTTTTARTTATGLAGLCAAGLVAAAGISGASAAPSDDAASADEAPAHANTVALRDGTIDGIELPASQDEIQGALTDAWGDPDAVLVGTQGCGPDDEKITLQWGGFTAYGYYPEGGTPQIESWSVDNLAALPDGADTPFDIVPGTPWDLAEDVVPGAELLDHFSGGEQLTTEERDGLTWLSDQDLTEVTSAGWNLQGCD